MRSLLRLSLLLPPRHSKFYDEATELYMEQSGSNDGPQEGRIEFEVQHVEAGRPAYRAIQLAISGHAEAVRQPIIVTLQSHIPTARLCKLVPILNDFPIGM